MCIEHSLMSMLKSDPYFLALKKDGPEARLLLDMNQEACSLIAIGSFPTKWRPCYEQQNGVMGNSWVFDDITDLTQKPAMFLDFG